MKAFKRAVLVFFALLLVFSVLVFILENQEPASLIFMGLATPQLPISLFFVLALLVGMAIGPFLSLLVFRKKSLKSRRNIAVE